MSNANTSIVKQRREPSMYKRLSSHITSIDLPDLPDLPDAFRETASRVESALQHARSSYENHSKKEKDKDKQEKKEKEKGNSEEQEDGSSEN